MRALHADVIGITRHRLAYLLSLGPRIDIVCTTKTMAVSAIKQRHHSKPRTSTAMCELYRLIST